MTRTKTMFLRTLVLGLTVGTALGMGCQTTRKDAAMPVDPVNATDAAAEMERAREIHERAWVLDAHADIEIPGRPSPYAGPTVSRASRPTRCVRVASMPS